MNQLTFTHLPPDEPRLAYLPPREQPARRVAEQPHGCSLLELLAALIGGPRQLEIAEALLRHFKSLTAMRQAHAEEITNAVSGIGLATAARLIAALELGQRLALEAHAESPVIHGPRDVAVLVQYEMGAYEQEHLRVLYLNTRNRVLGWEDIYKGSVNAAQVRVAEIFKGAVRRNAPAIVLAHNHPSGDPSPSPDDVGLTRAVIQAGKLLNVEVLDHLIFGRQRYVSLKDKGLGFS